MHALMLIETCCHHFVALIAIGEYSDMSKLAAKIEPKLASGYQLKIKEPAPLELVEDYYAEALES